MWTETMGGELSKKRRFDEKRDLWYFHFCVQASIFGILERPALQCRDIHI